RNVSAHTLDEVFRRRTRAKIFIEAEALDQGVEPLTAENRLCDRLHTTLRHSSHRGFDEVLRDLLTLHENADGRPVDVWQKQDDARGRGEGGHGDEDRRPFSPIPHPDQTVEARVLMLGSHSVWLARLRYDDDVTRSQDQIVARLPCNGIVVVEGN